MVTGWRRAFCTSIPKDRETKILSEKHRQQHCEISNVVVQSPKFSSKFGFFSNPSTPRLQSQPISSPSLQCRTTANTTTTPTSSVPNSPRLQCKTETTTTKNSSPRLFQFSNPLSPKSPSSFSLLKASLRLSKSRCGICSHSVKTGQGSAIFTAECSHTFHFHCISSHIKKHQLLICPICNATWKELPLLAIQENPDNSQDNCQRESTITEVETKCLRVYNDDEPLRSPTCGTRFNPIPESDENEEDENGAVGFQGFLVRSAPSSSPRFNGRAAGNDMFRNVEVRLFPEAAVVAVGKSYETCAVVLKVKAPPSPALNPDCRAPIDLVTVLDVSRSMCGLKLQMMRRAMRLVISSLSATDRLSIVAFAEGSKRLLPLTRMTTKGRRSARKIVDALGCVGQEERCANDALMKAAKVLEDRRERNPVASIMLLSKGHDERGSPSSANARRSSPLCFYPKVSSSRFAHLEIPVHTICFDDQHPEDALAKCVGGLLSMVVQDLRVQLGFVCSSGPAEIICIYSLKGRPTVLGSCSARLGDLCAEEERELLVELKIPTSSIGSHPVLSVRPSFRDPSTQQLVYCKERAFLIPRPHSVRSTSPNIQRLRNLHITTRAVAESRRLIEHNNLSGAYHLLTSGRALLMQSRSESAEEFMSGLEVELTELQYRRLQLQQLQGQIPRASNGREEINRVEEKPEPLTPTSAWRAAERLAKVAIMRKSMNRVSDLHGFEDARF
ncbi:E3 ubiquitin-protein ligase WAVH1-like [Juglans microcarpa x Juglans regia]|uniref:E3 ubiquitin-protein ligase WAVH1-like n=1 Tax=Juglans microcarpa x Juglans regia TaxID=2249226 RepID=UPI001B7DFA72|nr:E3 ubiquitin-protein ligase WAVH1-like [Juglans microcarpa x Juglans regia]